MRRETLLLAFILISMFAISTISVIPAEAATSPLFKITLIAPGNANIVRRQWGTIIANSLQSLGIDARIVFLGWTAVYDRYLQPPVELVGKTFDHGGFDIGLIGYTPGLIANPRTQFLGDPGFLAPYGQNYYLFNTTTSNDLLNLYVTTTNATVREKALKDWQWYIYNQNPDSVLLFESNVAAVNPAISGYDWIYFNVQPSPQWLKKDPASSNPTTVIYASTGEIDSLIPPSSNSWYDTIILNTIFNGLIEVNNAKQFIPSLVQSYSASSDGHTWTLNLRHGVKWHTGWTFTADDVLFSYMTLMNTHANSQFVGYYSDVLGNDVKLTWLNGTATRVYYDGIQTTITTPASALTGTRQGNITAIDAYTVKIYMPNVAGLSVPYGFFEAETLSYANNIIPKHVFEQIPVSEWANSPLNTGTGTLSITLNSSSYTIKGPIGTGPYKWDSFDPTTQLVHLTKFTSFWNATPLESIGQFGITDYYIKYIADKTPALAALKNGEVDMLDPNYHMQKDVPSINPSWGVVVNLPGAGRQEMGFNMRHPILGTGTGTPLGTAEAARHVRLAIDYAIPRQLIIDNLLDGYGTAGVTSCLPTQLYYNTSIPVRPYDLTKARQELALAGYTVPGLQPGQTTLTGFVQGMSTRFSGLWLNPTGTNPMPNEEIQLQESYDNATWTTIEPIITDNNGKYAATVTPSQTGRVIYRLVDPTFPAGTESRQIGYWNVTTLSAAIASSATTPLTNQINSLQSSLTDQINSLKTQNNYLMIGIVFAVIIAIAAILMGRRG